jgi:hypothetical protein
MIITSAARQFDADVQLIAAIGTTQIADEPFFFKPIFQGFAPPVLTCVEQITTVMPIVGEPGRVWVSAIAESGAVRPLSRHHRAKHKAATANQHSHGLLLCTASKKSHKSHLAIAEPERLRDKAHLNFVNPVSSVAGNLVCCS